MVAPLWAEIVVNLSPRLPRGMARQARSQLGVHYGSIVDRFSDTARAISVGGAGIGELTPVNACSPRDWARGLRLGDEGAGRVDCCAAAPPLPNDRADPRHRPLAWRKENCMSATGLEVFDKTVQTTNAWLKEIMEATGLDRRRAYRALAAVLHALRDRLPVHEVAPIGAQLPILVRGLYYDQWHHPAGKAERLRHKEEFLAAVAAGLDDIGPINPA